MNKNTKGLEKSVLQELYIRQGKPIRKIADELGVAAGSVYNYMKMYQIPTRPKKEVFTFKGRKQSESVKKRISELHKGKRVSEETKRKQSIAKKQGINGITKEGHKKKHTSGYILVYAPEHPNASKDGYVFEHTLVIERKIGRYLSKNEVAHHINHRRDDNRELNLILMDKKEHQSLHMKVRHFERRLLSEHQ